MSGICGLLALDGGAVEPGNIEAMAVSLERRGPDGTRIWQSGPIALGHTLLATTPESLVERLPMTDGETGCTITADVRLDNREELITALELTGKSCLIGDSELILRAYLRWGEACPEHLLGDFAFAIWDPRGGKLFCARDHMGMRQLIYCHLPGQLFLFATEPLSILAHPDVPRRMNEARIADFLDSLEGHDLTSTFFDGLHRLPPAHSLTLDNRRLRLSRYWSLRAAARADFSSDEACTNAFLDIFYEAVRCRLRCAGPVGAMLSGGIDSSSVAIVAARIIADEGGAKLTTFSAVGPDLETCPETRAVQSAMAGGDYSCVLVDHSELARDSGTLIELAEASAEPFDGNMTLQSALYLEARRRGVKVILDGAAGDMALASGNRVAELLRQGRFRSAVHEATGEKQFRGPVRNRWRALLEGAWAAFVPPRIRGLRRTLAARLQDRTSRVGSGLIAPGFARRVNLTQRRRQLLRHSGSARPFGMAYRLKVLQHPNLVAARERYDRVASALGIEPRDPFMDIRLLRFCLSLPSAQMQADGWPKIILRRAMEGLLPAELVWRRGKKHLGWTFTRSLLSFWNGWADELNEPRSPIRRLINSCALDAATMDMEAGFKLTILSRWIRHKLPPDAQ